jgi:hypothetical protein
LVNDFGGLFLNLVSYINSELFSPIFEPFGFPVLFNVFGVIGPVLLQVAWMFLEPEFDPGVIGMPMAGMFLSPPGTVLSV